MRLMIAMRGASASERWSDRDIRRAACAAGEPR